ncbi:NAD-dependent epimerase/dehydratase family protein [Natranaeroarchaeum sulfidigenes]|uniref:YbjT n=1 Tax=Natranaeroarchaeum sulfidigenes TaxID=2784880 RepID=A0A897MSX6_9EURY|nr:NAD(P)-dependent oxidoreductase [Natranaeroarchaeum sulfidigenes]QSG03401.1 YbjT [Natranaeroarchaeum sulfidigenes]
MHILVTGGNGFIGRRVCANAIAAGHDVTSVARSGPPTDGGSTGWADRVDWIEADVFSPQEWRFALSTVDCVVHSIGTISETPETGVTFERLNGDSAIVAALEAERAGVDRFVYVSSSTKPPLVRDAYMTARRRAEAAVADLELDVLIPRFGPVYGPDQPHFPALANYLFTAVGELEPIARRLGEDRPFSVEMAGRAIYELAVTDDPPASPITAETLAALAR